MTIPTFKNAAAAVSVQAAASSVELYDSRTPRTSPAVRGRWTAEYVTIKAELVRQKACINQVRSGNGLAPQKAFSWLSGYGFIL